MPNENDGAAGGLLGAPRRKRNYLGHVKPPTNRRPDVRYGTIDGQEVVWVELSGKYGQGNEMVLDAADWATVAQVEPWWLATPTDTKWRYVSRGTSDAKRLATEAGIVPQSPSTHPNITLAKVLMHAGADEVVWQINRDFLDLRRVNLQVLPVAEWRDLITAANAIQRSMQKDGGE